MTNILATKLTPPVLPPKRVPRPHLIQRLDEGLEYGRRITLVSAPAGFGKTICVSEWVSTLEGWPVSWLSLDPADDDPGRFFTYLIASLQKVDQHLGQEIAGVLRAGQLPPAEIISTTLINAILDLGHRFLLILDDFQVIQDDFILQVIEALVDNLPQVLYLVLLTREDPSLPLARLRANSQLTEIRAADLRFSVSETEQFLNQVMGLSLSPEDIRTLEKRTEGWVVGLHLAGLSIRDRADPSDFIATLSGSHRFILSYLTEEVLNLQPEEIQHFLLQTSILERLNGDLCDAVTGRTDSHMLLEELLNANLFLIPLDEEGHWYRYHQLFADLLLDLQERHQRENTAERHQRASGWYRQAGMIREAIHHTLAAGDYASAVHLIEVHAMDMLMQWHVKTVDGWLRAIPAVWAAQSPRANLAFAWMYLMRADHARAIPYLERLGTMFADPQKGAQIAQEDPALEAKWLALQAMLLNAQGKQADSLQRCNRALEIVPDDDIQVRAMIYLGLANAYQQMDDYGQAMEAYQVLIQLGRAAGNSVVELLGVSGLGLLAIEHGQYHFAFEIVTQGIESIERAGTLPPISTALYGELAVIHYQWHQLEQAHGYFQRAIQVSALSGYSDAELYYGVILSRLYHIQGDLKTAAEKIQKAVELMHVEAPAAVRDEVINQQVRIHLAQGDLAAAERTLAGRGFSTQDGLAFPATETTHKVPLFSRDKVTRSEWILYISALRILLYRSQINHDVESLNLGLELAGYLVQTALQNQYIPFTLETLLVRAQLQAALGMSGASQADYLQALELGEAEGLISIFLEEGPPAASALASLLKQDRLGKVNPEYVRKILAAFPEERKVGGAPDTGTVGLPEEMVEPLSQREVEILRLIEKGYSNQQIADHLVITLHTVKKHSSNIYAKLGVSSRTQAVAQARQLKLL